ncbi:MAG: hypothetical protein AAGN66_30230, partial [Acidobacteriota bacterium]
MWILCLLGLAWVSAPGPTLDASTMSAMAIPGAAAQPWAVRREMVRWAGDHVPSRGSVGRRSALLWRALVSRRGLGIREEVGASGPATEVFDRR